MSTVGNGAVKSAYIAMLMFAAFLAFLLGYLLLGIAAVGKAVCGAYRKVRPVEAVAEVAAA